MTALDLGPGDSMTAGHPWHREELGPTVIEPGWRAAFSERAVTSLLDRAWCPRSAGRPSAPRSIRSAGRSQHTCSLSIAEQRGSKPKDSHSVNIRKRLDSPRVFDRDGHSSHNARQARASGRSMGWESVQGPSFFPGNADGPTAPGDVFVRMRPKRRPKHYPMSPSSRRFVWFGEAGARFSLGRLATATRPTSRHHPGSRRLTARHRGEEGVLIETSSHRPPAASARPELRALLASGQDPPAAQSPTRNTAEPAGANAQTKKGAQICAAWCGHSASMSSMTTMRPRLQDNAEEQASLFWQQRARRVQTRPLRPTR